MPTAVAVSLAVAGSWQPAALTVSTAFAFSRLRARLRISQLQLESARHQSSPRDATVAAARAVIVRKFRIVRPPPQGSFCG